MKNAIKRITAFTVMSAMLLTSVSAMSAPLINFVKNNDGTASVNVEGKTGVERVAISQYDDAGHLINFGISQLGSTSATTRSEYSWSPYYQTKITTFSDWSNLTSTDGSYRLGTRTLDIETFEEPHNLQLARYDNYLDVKSGEGNGGGSALYFKHTDGSQNESHASMNGARSLISDFVVYEVDLRLVKAKSHINIYIMGGDDPDGTDTDNSMLYVYPNEASGATTTTAKLGSGNPSRITLNTGVWYTLSASVNYKDEVAVYELKQGDNLVATYTGMLTDDFGYGDEESKPAGMRVHTANRYWTHNGSIGHEFYIDNMRIYEGTQPRETEDLNDIIYLIDPNTTETVFESEDTEKTKLSGTYAVHSRSGVTYNGESKTLLESTPYTDNGVTYVPVDELAAAWGVNLSGVTKDSDGYASLSAVATALGKNVYYDTNTQYNNGMCVLANSFTYPTNATELQKLNDFLFYLRPTDEQIESAYSQSETKRQHPRIMGTPDDFARVREEYRKGTNPTFMAWANSVIGQANYMKNYPAGTSWFEDHFGYDYYGGRIGSPVTWSSQAAAVYAMAYQLTGNTVYTDRLYEALESMASFPNWNPNHHLDPARISLGFSIAYDWCYDVWTQEQRAFIEQAVYEKLFYEAAEGYKSVDAKMNNFAINTSNHNIATNGNIAVAAMAFMDAYPEECTYLLRNAIRGADIMMYRWGPDGSWYEGLGYWEFTMNFTTNMLSSLDSTFGTSFGLDKCDGLDTAAEFAINSQTQNGVHNYCDTNLTSTLMKLYTSEMLWLGKKYGNEGVTRAVLKQCPTGFPSIDDLAYSLLWYDTSVTSTNVTLPLDAIYEADDVITMRNNWEQDSTSSFVGIRGGETNNGHGQMDGGSFVFEQGGIRWAIDLGAENYNVPSYWDTTYRKGQANRWAYWRSMAESHNTVVVDQNADYTGHAVDSYTEVELIDANDLGAIAVADMSSVLSRTTTSAKRGYFYTDNRESLVIRDEITFKTGGSHTVDWFMLTGEDDHDGITKRINVAVDSATNSAILTDVSTNKKMKLEFVVTGGTAEITADDTADVVAELIDDGFVYDTSGFESTYQGNAESNRNRINIKVTGTGTVTITVKLTPVGAVGATPITNYTGAISSWSL